MSITNTFNSFPATITSDGTYLFEVGGASAGLGNFNTVYANGDFGGGTLSAYVTPDGGDTNMQLVTGSALLANGWFNVLAKSGGLILKLVGATNPNIKIWIR